MLQAGKAHARAKAQVPSRSLLPGAERMPEQPFPNHFSQDLRTCPSAAASSRCWWAALAPACACWAPFAALLLLRVAGEAGDGNSPVGRGSGHQGMGWAAAGPWGQALGSSQGPHCSGLCPKCKHPETDAQGPGKVSALLGVRFEEDEDESLPESPLGAVAVL